MSVEGSSNKTIRVQKKRLASLLKDSERSGISLDLLIESLLTIVTGTNGLIKPDLYRCTRQ
jgi:hypothetical protein